ncbi:MAG: type II secretion system protein GspD [Alphaproteobacteria bacterium]|nr:MAG: type II secretion system protein GspD [Alphaproteobacteria bacterium]
MEGPPVSLNFEEAPVAQVVRTVLGDILKVDYVLHPPLAGTVTLATRNPVSPDQAAFLLESALQANGLGLTRDARGTYHVGRAEVLRTIGGNVRQAGGSPLPPGQGVIVVPLQYIGAAEMATILRPMMPAESMIRVDNLRNLLVLAGTRTQAEGWLDMVSTFDVDLLKGMSVGVFPLKYASIKEIEAALALVSGAGGGATPSPSPQAAGRGAVSAATQPSSGTGAAIMLGEGNPLFGALRIMPIERLNSILVVTPRASYLEEARRWIERLDQPSDNGAEAQLHIFKVQNGNAKHLASVLSGIFGSMTGGSSSAGATGVAPGLSTATGNTFGQSGIPNAFGNTASLLGGAQGNRTGAGLAGGGSALGGRGTGQLGSNTQAQQNTQQAAPAVAAIGNVRVMADELNNSLLVWGTRAEYGKIEATLKRLDLPPTQVLIEATIVEVTLGDTLNYGVQWAFSDSPEGSSFTGAGNVGGLNTSTLGGVTQGFSYILSKGGNARAVLQALANKSQLKVISSPSLMVLDNHTAAITVGDQEPISTASFIPNGANTIPIDTIQYKDTGVGLTVTPSVNAGNLVTMQVDQTVTQLGDRRDDANKQPSFQQRQISSKVAVRSGDSIVLGGLIRDNTTTGKTGVPFLQDIPLVGNLFGTNRNNNTRTELLVVLTPRVVRTDIDIREVSEDLRDRLKGLKVFGPDERKPHVPITPQPSPAN